MPGKPTFQGPAIPLARWADRKIGELARDTGSARIAALNGATLMGERAALGGFVITGKVSAGPGSSRLYRTRDGHWFALTIPRPDDRALLPALFGDEAIDTGDNEAIAHAVAGQECATLLETGRLLGLPVAAAHEMPVAAPAEILVTGPVRQREPGHRPLVIDLSAIWAGPLIGHLLWLAGAEVVKVESRDRPDELRDFDPGIFALLNQGKANVALNLKDEAEREALIALIRKADFIIESSRPRALRQLGIDAGSIVRETPGLVWLSVTGHGAQGETANWTGIGHECGVAGGLSRALAEVTGEIGYVGDAIADPLTGIFGALEGWRAYASGKSCRIGLSLSSIVALALREERTHDLPQLTAELAAWAKAIGQPFPAVERRPVIGEVRHPGADTEEWLALKPTC